MDIHEAMTRYPWLRELLYELPESMLSSVKVLSYRQRDIMIEHCEDNYYTYIILEGICSTCQQLENCVQFTIRKATSGDIIGFAGTYQKERAGFSAYISARTPVLAVRLPRTIVQECLGKYPSFSIGITERVISRLQQFITLLSECNNYPTLLGLVALLEYNYTFYLKQYPAEYSGPVEILESRQNMASFLGIDVRSVQRLLHKLKKQELIGISSRRVTVTKAQYEALHCLKTDWFLNAP